MEVSQYKSRTGTRLGVTAILLFVVVLLAAAATLSVIHKARFSGEGAERHYQQRELSEKMQNFIAEHQTIHMDQRAKRGKPSAYNACTSTKTNDSVPVAHIVGYHNWKTKYSPDESTKQTGYKTNWECMDNNNGQPFVDGGMCFNMTSNQLVVPTCGYYYVSSMVTFQVAEDENREVFHKMITNHSCPSDASLQTATVVGHTTVGQDNKEAASYVDQVVMLCAGGTVQVSIPDTAPCCGEGKYSYINAFMVKETACTWHKPVTLF